MKIWTCSVCNKKLFRKSKSGKCRDHKGPSKRTPSVLTRKCLIQNCEVKITNYNKSGLCTRHCQNKWNERNYASPNKKKILERSGRYYRENKERFRELTRQYYKDNKATILNRAIEHQKKNPQKPLDYSKKYRKKNSAKYAGLARKRLAAKLNATPKLTEWELFIVELKYEFAKFLSEKTGIKYSVDHYFPLQGICCRGKHHPSNLRVIPLLQNNIKKNHCPLHKHDTDKI